MNATGGPRLHIVYADDWKDAVITLLEPYSPYRPWRCGDAHADQGDLVAYVLNTDPASVLTVTARIETDGSPLDAEFERPLFQPMLAEMSTLAMLAGVHTSIDIDWALNGDGAARFDKALDGCRYISPPASRFGHNSMAAARTLMLFSGTCEGCLRPIDLTGPDARDEIFVHTVEPYGRPERSDWRRWRISDSVDWSAVICRGCRDRMNTEGFGRFVDFKFAQHPACPECGARRTRATFYGMPSDPSNIRPWAYAAGCCVRSEEWLCDECEHEW